MTDLLAIISKAVFEADSKGAKPGQVLPLDRYVSTNKALEPLRAGGRLFLVTVRPPDEQLWLVGVLESPKHDGKAWVAKPNRQPITDISALRGKIRFTSNTGISATKGALGMSLQTPRQLTDADVALMLGGKVAAAPPPAPEAAPPKASPKAAAKPKPERAPTEPPPAPPPSKPGKSGDVAALLGAQQWAKALELLLERWRADRAPELAELIERVSARLPPTKEWRATAGDVARVDLVALLGRLTEGKYADSLARIQQLGKLPADPRVAAGLARLIVTPPFTAQSSREFWTALLEQLEERHADPRTLTALAPVAGDYQATFGRTKMGESMERRVQALVAALREQFPTTPQADVKAWLALVPAGEAAAPRATKGGRTLDELLAAVYASPDDETVRQVYADALLEVGDPRGEFMVLQLKRARGEALTPAEEKQEAALQKKHAKAWLGPLYEVLHTTSLGFRGGFLHTAQIRPVSKALAAARNHPAWSTVRELNMSTGGTNERGASLIVQPNARHIRTLWNVVYLVLDELAASPGEGRELELLHISWLPMGSPESENGRVATRAWQATLTGKAFPKLRELQLGREAASEPDALKDLWTSPLVKQLSRVRLVASYFHAAKYLSVAAREASSRLTVELDFGAVLFVVTPGGQLAISATGSAEYIWKDLVAALDPNTWKKVTVAKGALTDKEHAMLVKRLPKATIER
ncbi:MAG: TIGR02996 domain-containing protein [Myxococcota bacterium]